MVGAIVKWSHMRLGTVSPRIIGVGDMGKKAKGQEGT